MPIYKIIDVFSLTRKNHALEHATVHILSKKFPGRHLAGHSNPTGFFLIGDLPTESVAEAAAEALKRLQGGEAQLAIHPGCGTNLALLGLVPSVFALVVMSGTTSDKQRKGRFSVLFLAILGGIFLGKKMGPWAQREVTTDPNLTGVRIIEIVRTREQVHRIITSR